MRTPWRAPRRIPALRGTIVTLGLALTVGLLPQTAPVAEAREGLSRPSTQQSAPVRGKDLKARSWGKSDPAEKAAVRTARAPKWPKTGAERLDVGAKAAEAKDLPVRVARARTGGPAPKAVEVSVQPKEKAEAAGVDGVLLTLARSDSASKGAPVDLSVDYKDFAGAYGGNYASRLGLVEYPACLLTTPERAACRTGTPLKTDNDTEHSTLTARATAAPDTAADSAKVSVAKPGEGIDALSLKTEPAATVLAATAADSGGQGDFGATSLQPSSQWSVSNSSGAFVWSYPISAPPVPGGSVPSVSLGYNSQSVDGQTATTNNQGSWIGQGFSYEPGYIERRYKPCADDGHDDTIGDQCWAYDNATISLGNGTSGELIKDDKTGEWHVSSDDFSKVEKLTGATNGDDNGEHWKVTGADGTQYYFGLNRLPGYVSGDTETASAWTVPVYGDDSGEPCYNATFASAFCNQAWRWNLDYVVDPLGNATTYYWGKETNYYTQGLKTAENGKPYTRGGYLKRIEYGLREGAAHGTQPAARIVFDTAERCMGKLTDCSADALTDAKAADWPDVPWDRNCKADSKCPGQNSPTFWTRKQLTKITTQVRSGATTFKDVDSWSFGHTFTDNGDASVSLWLDSITQSGLVGTKITTPTIKLYGQQLPNRVDKSGDNIQPFNRFRLAGVESESGSMLSVNYADPQCSASSEPVEGKSTVRCFPVKWSPPGVKDPITEWFHKYVVSQVIERDLVGDSPTQYTNYTYKGDAGWRKGKPDGIGKKEDLTWSDWRGYQRVVVETSDGTNNAANEKSEHVYFQGLDGDEIPGGGTRSFSVTTSTGDTIKDDDWRSGFEAETLTYNGDKVVSKQTTTAWNKVTATRAADWGTRYARYVKPARTDVYTALASGGWRQTANTTTYDDTTGRVVKVADYGEVDVADNTCTTTQYADNATKHIYTAVARVEVLSVDCGTTPSRPKDVISDDVTLYDGTTTIGAAPTKGLTTAVKRLASYNGSAPVYQTVTSGTFDAYGRPLVVKDAAGTATTNTYTDTNGLATAKVEKNPLGWETRTEYAPERGLPSAQIDQNGKRTDLAYDSLGRLTSVWLPDRPRASDFSASITYEYGIRKDAPNYVRTRKIEKVGTSYSDEYTLYDGLLRPRQVQTEGPDGSRLIADTYYDGSGRTVKVNDTYHTTGAPSSTLFAPRGEDIDAQTVTEYDGASRVTASIFKVAGVEKNRTTYAYGGDRVHVDPPEGQTPTTTITDAQERTVELREYDKSAAPVPTGTAADYLSTSYTYDAADRLTAVQDEEGNRWTYGYDQRGRQVEANDPDTGKTTTTYDDLDRPVSVTDSRGNVNSTSYDVIGRTTATWEGAPDTGTKLSVSKWDTIAKGELYGEYTYKNNAVYSSVLYPVLDETYEPTTVKYAVSTSAEPKLGGSWEFNTEYNTDGTVQGQNFPAAGGLPAEALSYQYDELQRPTALNTSLDGLSYVTKATYSPTSQLQQVELNTGAAGTKKTWNTYDYEHGTNRLLSARVDVEGATAVAYDARYTYDQTGNVTSIVDKPSNGTTDAQCFRVDGLRRMTDAWTSKATANDTAGTGQTSSACAAAPSSANVGGTAPYWNTYTFDNTGNRATQTRNAIGSTPKSTVDYTYGEGDAGPHQLTKTVTQTEQGGGNPAVKAENTYTYDKAGNTDHRVLGGDTQTLEWNKQNDLTKVTEADGKETSYVYDSSGSRLVRDTPEDRTLYLPGMELKLTKATGKITGQRYYSFAGQTIAVRDADGVTFLASDQHGTAELAIDPVNGTTQRRRLDPFGEARDQSSSETGAWPTDKGFVGGTNDTSTGLVNLGAREYDPTTGRFLSADPIIDYTDPQQINGYAYSRNSPVTFSDPDGLKECADGACRGGADWVDRSNGNVYHQVQGHNDGCGGCSNAIDKHQNDAPTSWKMGSSPSQIAAARQEAELNAARERAARAKARAIAAAKEIAKVVADELGITDALDCFTTGSLGSCGATAINMITSFVGGMVGKLAAKYGMPWKWKKAAALAKRLWGLSKKLVSSFKDWRKGKKAVDKLEEVAEAAACPIRRPNSFTPGTQVLMADGSTKDIEDVDIGDTVLATDPETGKTTTETVTAEIKGTGLKLLVDITVDTDGDKGDETATITATNGHPFWVPSLHKWLNAEDLTPGTDLTTDTGSQVRIEETKQYTVLTTAGVYNLTVSDTHTYYVLAGSTAVLVHNDGGDPDVTRIQNLHGIALDDAHDYLEGNGFPLKSWSDGKGGKGGYLTYRSGDGSKVTIRDSDGRVTRTSVIDNGPNKKNGVQRWDESGNKTLSHDHGEAVTC
ncbi:RHS repeat-associated core domain-containing protein [Streptomyces sp. DT18]